MKHFLAANYRSLETSPARHLELTGPRVFPLPPNEAAKPADLVSAHVARRIVRKRTLHDFREIAAAVNLIDRLPERDESIHALMRGDFNAWDLVPAVLRLAAPATIRELCIATLGVNFRNARELLALYDKRDVASVSFVCSHYFQKSCPKEYSELRSGLVERGQGIAAVRSHAKIIAIKLADDRCVVVESSANLRSCRNIEQIAMTESPALYDFHRKWISEIAPWPKRNPPPSPARPL